MSKIGQALEKAARERLSIMENKPIVVKTGGKVEGSKVDPHITTYFDSASPISEQYRVLRTNIQSISSSRPPKTLLITSAVHGEGKTVTSINLAITMAHEPDKKVLLCDCDLRKGDVSRLLGLNIVDGLSEALSVEANASPTILDTEIENLKVLPSGNSPKNSSELLGSWKMKELLKILKPQFDYIVLDAPPIMPITDACVLSSQADGVIFVVRTARTQRETVQDAQSLLTQAKANILGYVLTGLQRYVPKYIERYL